MVFSDPDSSEDSLSAIVTFIECLLAKVTFKEFK